MMEFKQKNILKVQFVRLIRNLLNDYFYINNKYKHIVGQKRPPRIFTGQISVMCGHIIFIIHYKVISRSFIAYNHEFK